MNDNNNERSTYRLMLAAAVIVCLLLAVVILAFAMVQKKHESMISSIRNTQESGLTAEVLEPKEGEREEELAESETAAAQEDMESEEAAQYDDTDDSNEYAEIREENGDYDVESYAENDSQMVIISSGGGELTDADNTVYLIKGADKGSNKYERVDRLAYTDSVKYTEADLAYLDSYGLCITRNEIYARHGRMFNDQDVQEYFNRQSWYVAQMASNLFDESCLNEVERYNANLIRSYELKQGY